MNLYDALKKTNSLRAVHRKALEKLAKRIHGDVLYASIGRTRIISDGNCFAVPAAVLICLADRIVIADISSSAHLYYESEFANISTVEATGERVEIHVGEDIYSIKCAFNSASEVAALIKRTMSTVPPKEEFEEHNEIELFEEAIENTIGKTIEKTVPPENPQTDEPVKTFNFPVYDENGQHYTRSYSTHISGTLQYYGDVFSQTAIRNLSEGENVYLERQADNKYDPFAIRILNYEGDQFGWIPYADYGDSPMQFDLCNFLSDGVNIIARVADIYTRRDKTLGVMIDIRVY